jgi:dienelactone hydrolase
MACYEGETLKKRIERGPLATDAAVDIAAQTARGLVKAHEAGIVHRDIKPANLMITNDGIVKILDFGVAKLSGVTGLTQTGITVGTVSYMSPEQLSGSGADQSSDIWALGVVLYEMLAGRRPHRGDSDMAVMNAVLHGTPTPLRDAAPTVPAQLEQIVTRALQKDPKARYATAVELRRDLEDCRAALTAPATAVPASPRRLVPGVLIGAAAALLVLAGTAWWIWNSGADARWARNVAIPQIEQYVDESDWEAAYALAKQVQVRVPDEPALAELWPKFSWLTTIPSDPPGARVFRRSYSAKTDDWEELGTTPLEKIRVPFGLSRLRLELEGHRSMLRLLGGGVLVYTELPVVDSPSADYVVRPDAFKLDTDESAPRGMVRVPGWLGSDFGGGSTRFADSFLARYEVTNREYKTFVAAGGYERQDFWEYTFMRGGQAISWKEAMTLFTDKTGRPGPSTWEAGTYPDGQEDYPVSGVSWYEAAAYARFVGQELPTVHHWRHAFSRGLLSWLLPASNMERDGLAPVGQFQGMSWPGTFDMAGNVREWCFNSTGDRRFLLGGGWNDTSALITDMTHSQLPLDRTATNGFRLASTREDAAVRAGMLRPLSEPPVTDVADRKPVSDDVFRAYQSMYAYDPAPLKGTIESTDTTRDWTRERVSFEAAGGGQRMVLYLYLPRTGSPPFQTVLYWPGSAALSFTSIDQYPVHLDFILKSGRAVAFPVFAGSFERGGGKGVPALDRSAATRDVVIKWVNDLRRSIDYLETRADLDARAFSLYGHSWGGALSPTALAIEPRIRAAVLYVAGLFFRFLPEADPLTFLPRVHMPVLMLNGELDSFAPAGLVRPFFKLLGTADADKKNVVAPGGHFVPRPILIRETLDWLDKYLGPVRR